MSPISNISETDSSWPLTAEEIWIASTNNKVYYSILFPVALCGNVFTLSAVVMILRIKKSIPNLLIGVLASADLASLLMIHTITVASMCAGRWIGDDNLCRFQSVVSFTYFKLGFFSKTNISIDRFIALKYPLKYRTLVTTRKVVLVVLFNVLFSIGTSALTWVIDPEYIHQLETSYTCTNDFSIYTSYKLSIIIIEGGLFIMGCTIFFIGNLTVVKVMLSLSKKLKKTHSTQAIRKIATVTAPIFTDISQTLALQELNTAENSKRLPVTPLSRKKRQKSYTLAYINKAVTEDEEYKERGDNSAGHYNNANGRPKPNTLPFQRYRKNGQVNDVRDIQQKLSLNVHTNQKQRKQKKELKFAKLILVISSVFVVLWMPFMVS